MVFCSGGVPSTGTGLLPMQLPPTLGSSAMPTRGLGVTICLPLCLIHLLPHPLWLRPTSSLFQIPPLWLMSLKSPTVFDFFQVLVGVFLTFQFPVFTLLAGSVLTYLWSADAWDYVVLVLAPVVQWFLVHPLPLILVFFWIMLLVVVVVLLLCSWFRVDLYPLTRCELHAYCQTYLCATKLCHCFCMACHQPPTLTDQAILCWSRELYDMARALERLCHQHCLRPHLPHGHGGLSSGHCPAQVPAPSPMKPSPRLGPRLRILPSQLPFCLPTSFLPPVSQCLCS